MLQKVRRLKVKQKIDGLLENSEILWEFYDYPDHFYSENQNNTDIFTLKTMCQYIDFNTLFEELEPIEKEKTPQYKLLISK